MQKILTVICTTENAFLGFIENPYACNFFE